MNHLTVAASAQCRLHADVMLIRLRRAEIDCQKISVLYPTHSMPNAVGCWLPTTSGSVWKLGQETIARAGQLRAPTDVTPGLRESDDGHEIVDFLAHTGIDTRNARILASRLEEGHSLICVHATTEAEVTVAWHIFRHSSAETIVGPDLPAELVGLATSGIHERHVQQGRRIPASFGQLTRATTRMGGLARKRPPMKRETLAHLLRISLARLQVLTSLAKAVRRRVQRNPAFNRLRSCVENLLGECQVLVRALQQRAAALGLKVKAGLVRGRSLRHAYLAESAGGSSASLPEKMTRSLLSQCEACGRRLSSLIRIARETCDVASEQAASASLRILERQLWILRPYAVRAQ